MGKKKILRRLRKKPKHMASGNHAKCYKHPTDKDKVLLVTNCVVRAGMASGDFPTHRCLPKVKCIGSMHGVPVYEMERLYDVDIEKLSGKDRSIYSQALHMGHHSEIIASNKLSIVLRDIFDTLKESHGGVSWDACGHNMMMTKNGKLVLNDIIWVNGSEI